MQAKSCLPGVVVQLVRIPACHAGGRGFESRPLRQISTAAVARLQRFFYAFLGTPSVRRPCKHSETVPATGVQPVTSGRACARISDSRLHSHTAQAALPEPSRAYEPFSAADSPVAPGQLQGCGAGALCVDRWGDCSLGLFFGGQSAAGGALPHAAPSAGDAVHCCVCPGVCSVVEGTQPQSAAQCAHPGLRLSGRGDPRFFAHAVIRRHARLHHAQLGGQGHQFLVARAIPGGADASGCGGVALARARRCSSTRPWQVFGAGAGTGRCRSHPRRCVLVSTVVPADLRRPGAHTVQDCFRVRRGGLVCSVAGRAAALGAGACCL